MLSLWIVRSIDLINVFVFLWNLTGIHLLKMNFSLGGSPNNLLHLYAFVLEELQQLSL